MTMKMTILFSALAAIMLLTVSGSMAHAEQIDVEELKDYTISEEDEKQLLSLIESSTQIKTSVSPLASAESLEAAKSQYTANKQSIKAIQAKYAADISDLDYYTLKVGKELVTSNKNLNVWGTGIDRHNNVLMVRIAPDDYTKQVENRLSKVLGDTRYVVQVLENDFELNLGACNLSDVCNPVIGAAKLQDKEFARNCSTSIGAERNVWWWTEDGVITAGHCYKDNATNGKTYQPDDGATSYKFGDVTKRVFNNNCDCEFIKADSRTVNKSKINMGTYDYPFSGKDDVAADDLALIRLGYSEATYVKIVQNLDGDPGTAYMYNGSSNLDDLIVVKGLTTQDGDSGSPLLDYSDNNYSGMYVGKSTALDEYYFIQWGVLDSNLDLN